MLAFQTIRIIAYIRIDFHLHVVSAPFARQAIAIEYDNVLYHPVLISLIAARHHLFQLLAERNDEASLPSLLKTGSGTAACPLLFE